MKRDTMVWLGVGAAAIAVLWATSSTTAKAAPAGSTGAPAPTGNPITDWVNAFNSLAQNFGTNIASRIIGPSPGATDPLANYDYSLTPPTSTQIAQAGGSPWLSIQPTVPSL